MCHAVRAPGSKVTLAHCTSAGSGAWKSGSIRTVPVNQSDGPWPDGCDPILLISISHSPLLFPPLTLLQYVIRQHLAPRDTVLAAPNSSSALIDALQTCSNRSGLQ